MAVRSLSSPFLILGCAVSVYAQTEVGDSAKAEELKEVVVQGRTQRVIRHGVEYIPD